MFFFSSGPAALLLLELLAIFPQLNALPSPSQSLKRQGQPSAPLIPPQDIPITCQSECSIISTLAACTTPACGCTNSNGQELLVCLQCIVSATNATQLTINAIQADLTNVVQACQTAGIPINSLTLNGESGQSPPPPPSSEPPTDTPTDTNPDNGTESSTPDEGGDGITTNGTTTAPPPVGDNPGTPYPIIQNGNGTTPGESPAGTPSSPTASTTGKNSAESMRVGSFTSIVLPLLAAQIFLAIF